MMKQLILVLGLCLLAAACVCGCTGGTAETTVAVPEPPLPGGNITIINGGDSEMVLDWDAITAMPAFEGYGYGVSTVGIKYGPL
ncbi:hypothetical protein [Methanogenium cariaci]|uniref:hypothetical protein n=1 Tax=Methanogenium cariaci TaxID=2197 RepID=UPI0007848BC7|nr:hypothetical protein [Methanogenium cariaci]